MQINTNVDTRSFDKTLSEWEKQPLPFAIARALTQAGVALKNPVRGATETGFDRPARYTQSRSTLPPSIKNYLICTVELKNMAQKDVPASERLAP